MSRQARPFPCSVAAVGALLALAIASFADPAAAASDLKRASHFAEQLSVQTQRMSTASLLVVLGIDKAQNLGTLSKSREAFGRVFKALRDGDSAMGLSPRTEPNVLKLLAEVEALWPQFDAVVRSGLDAGDFSTEQVATIGNLNEPLFEATHEMAAALHQHANEKQLRSMLEVAAERAEDQTWRLQKMSKQFLLIAAGHNVERNRKDLSDTSAEFSRSLAGLIEGDPESKLLPAPNPEIRAQLRRVERLWDEFLPLVKSPAEGDKPAPEDIQRLAQLMSPLDKELQAAAEMFEEL